MHPAWAPEVIVDAQLAAQLISAQFPALATARVEPFAQGWDNTAYLANDTWVFRFPRRQIAVELIRTETNLLPKLAPQLPLKVPIPEWLGTSSDAFPWPFAGYRLLQGVTGCRARLSERERLAAAGPMAEFLATLHGIDVSNLPAPADTLERANMDKRKAELLRRVDHLGKNGHLKAPDQLTRHVEQATYRKPLNDLRLCHGDLYSRHVLFNRLKLPCAVIDWGDLHQGDAAVDLALAYVLLPERARHEFFKSYGPVDDSTHQLAHARALFSAVATLSYGLALRDEALVAESQAALGFLGFH